MRRGKAGSAPAKIGRDLAVGSPPTFSSLTNVKRSILAPPAIATASVRGHRRILILEDEPSIRNLLYVLLTHLGCEGEVALSGRQALAMVRRESFDAVLLDLRSSEVPAKEVIAEIQAIQPTLLGRVLVITGQVADAQTLELVEQYCVPVIPRDRVMQDMLTYLRPVLGFAR